MTATASEALRVGSLCTGYGGLDLAVHEVLGGEFAWVADNDPGASAILAHRFPSVPNLGDISTADWGAVEPVDVLTAGFPCQDISCAGRRTGLREGNRSGLWFHVARAIAALKPPLVIIENVKELLSAGADSNMEPCAWCVGDSGHESVLRALGAVLGDLAEVGFDAEWTSIRASGAGAPHRRERVFILAWPASDTGSHEPGRDDPFGGDSAGHSRQRPGAGHRGAPEDPDRAAGGERRQPASGQAESGRSRADAGGPGRAPAADADIAGRQGGESARRRVVLARSTPADTHGRGWRPDEPDDAPRQPDIDWGAYRPAITRWAAVTGRSAPRPTEPGRTGERLSPRFVEWMQGLPEGWVTDVPGLSRNAQLKALGNGVVPQQAVMAARLLLNRAGFAAATEAA